MSPIFIAQIVTIGCGEATIATAGCKARRRLASVSGVKTRERLRAERRHVGGVIGACAACFEPREIAEIGKIVAGRKCIDEIGEILAIEGHDRRSGRMAGDEDPRQLGEEFRADRRCGPPESASPALRSGRGSHCCGRRQNGCGRQPQIACGALQSGSSKRGGNCGFVRHRHPHAAAASCRRARAASRMAPGGLRFGQQDRPFRHVIVAFDQARQRPGLAEHVVIERENRIGDRRAMRIDEQRRRRRHRSTGYGRRDGFRRLQRAGKRRDRPWRRSRCCRR